MNFLPYLIAVLLQSDSTPALPEGYNLLCKDVLAKTERLDENTAYMLTKKIDAADSKKVLGMETAYTILASEPDTTPGDLAFLRETKDITLGNIFEKGEDLFVYVFDTDPDHIETDYLYFAPTKQFVFSDIHAYLKKQGVCAENK